MTERYDLTATAPTVRRADPSIQRYDPWRLGLYVTAAVAMPLAVGGIGWYWLGGQAWLLGALPVPVSIFLSLWSLDAWLVEHARLRAERQSWNEPPVAPTTPHEAPAPELRQHLRLGLAQNGRIVAPSDDMDPALVALRAKCLTLARAGVERRTWSRSALAEGEGAVMSGQDWDEASAELQHLGLFEVKAGRGGGLRPARPDNLEHDLARLEVAR